MVPSLLAGVGELIIKAEAAATVVTNNGRSRAYRAATACRIAAALWLSLVNGNSYLSSPAADRASGRSGRSSPARKRTSLPRTSR
jgi:hypothetical protein